MEAEYKVYAEEESRLIVGKGNSREATPLPPNQLSQEGAITSYAQAPQSTLIPPCAENKPQPKEDDVSLV